ncbi:Pimeloyl-ACP methyl ester carboxylesterase [Hymenobacter gelipurpurascens]|uniref:Pimeloyl-ACP methyl ester carboxylesterase n=1 Tax=Hymenobacter gelipurpurascens TaxID=89968 RepID=A0A212THJ7_9BACT|nr:alpha/beta hydrolase [Hymenobacter gelipurpurascens]SNC65463.1 Pimeloyl-ACP methyl ester carboxylesterase [Hymenobacter gelipurpurascens]
MTRQLLFLLLLFTSTAFGQQRTAKPLRAFLQAAPSPKGAIQYGNNPKAGHYAQAGDAKIYYEVYGKGRPFVLLHGGIFGSTYEMGRLIDSLSRKYQVIAVSTRGHGKSELGTAPLTYEQRAGDVLAVLKATTRDSAIVFGFSDGGFTAFKLASMYPERVRKLIVMGASELAPGMRDFTFSTQQAFALDSAYMRQQLALMPQPQRLAEMFTQVGNMYSHLTVDKALLQTIQCPTLVMAGDRDEGNPVQRVLNTARMIRRSQLAIVPNASHGAFLINFPATWADMVPFIK